MTRKRKSRGFLRGLKGLYEKKYKQLFIIPIVLAFIQIGVQTATTGDFMNKGVSLSGGVSITIQTDADFNAGNLERTLEGAFPDLDVEVRSLSSAGITNGLIASADIQIEDDQKVQAFEDRIASELGITLTDDNSNVEMIGSTLGASFFQTTIRAVFLAFLAMGVVVFIYFRTFAPSAAVMLAAFSDIIITLAIANVIGMKITTAGIAAFLMMIGYSVDTDILLSVRVLKKRGGDVMERVYNAMRTGVTMTVSTMVALLIAIIVAQSQVLDQIMTILLIGLFVDLINTWIQNVAIIRMYLERK